jgi:DNA-directed RNA polymerase specialized sigma24 family protein
MPQQPVDMGEAILRSLVGAMARRDAVAFLAFYAALCPEVYARLLTAVRDPAAAGALTESAFVYAWLKAPTCGSAEPVRAWLQRIVDEQPGIARERTRLDFLRQEFRRLLCRADADADALRSAHHREPP